MYSKDRISAKFIEFFQQNNHHHHIASKLVRNQDTLFTVAGMQQFQNYFLGLQEPPYPSYVTAQPCVRISGKHNDIENIGFTTRHNTMFTMLGNFSFGSLHKKDAIRLAWEFLSKIGIDQNYLYVTIHSSDKNAKAIWEQYIGSDRIIVIDSDDNFWRVGDLGLCGPCTEIFFDTKKRKSLPYDQLYQSIVNGVDLLEIWNIVFMEFNRTITGLDVLQKPCIDTGMGLERLVSVLEGHFDNFKVEPMKSLKFDLEKLGCSRKYSALCADHIYTIKQLLQEDLRPGAKGAGYVLRLLIRKCYKHFDKLTEFCNNPIITKEIHDWQEIIQKSQNIMESLDQINENNLVQLYHTHGLPVDLLRYYSDKYQLNYDKVQQLVKKHRDISQNKKLILDHQIPTQQLCYEFTENDAVIVNLFDLNGHKVNTLTGQGYIIVDQSCFYGQGGGQLGDTGTMTINQDHTNPIKITNCTKQKLNNNEVVLIHYCYTKIPITIGQKVYLSIDKEQREQYTRAHSGVHILSEILVFKHNKQIAGSSVKADQYTLDFVGKPFDQQELQKIFQECNHAIKQKLQKKTLVTLCKNVSSVFGADKHSAQSVVRVVQFGDQFKQLCGGTHVKNTKDIIHITLQKQKRIGSNITRLFVCVGVQSKRQSQKNNHHKAQLLFKSDKPLITVYDGNKLVKQNAQKDLWYLNLSENKKRIKGLLYNGSLEDIKKIEQIGCQGRLVSNIYSFGHRCLEYQKLIRLFIKQ